MSVIATIRREVIKSARTEGVEPAAAVRIADRVCSAVRRRHGPGREYIPAPDPRERNKRIVEAKVNGKGVREIAKEEGVHPSTAYRVISQEFGSDEWAL